ncbi:MAG TPA: hypothetical protein EYP17_04465 [Candidatus Latescibacteria bacterium]|nr:hypothetical protein [Candidatus Latescibacterota bacterium]
MKPEDAYRYIEEWLKVLRRRRQGVDTTRRLLWTGALLFFSASGALALEGLIYLPPPAKWALWCLVGGVGLSALVLQALWPLFRRMSLETLAGDVEGAFPELRDELTASLQLWSRREHNPEGYSVHMIEALAEDTARRLEGVDRGHLVDRKGVRRAARVFGISLPAFALAFLLWPEAPLRLAHPRTRFLPPDHIRVSVLPGDTTVVEGEDCTVRVQVEGKLPPEVAVYVKEGGVGRWEEVRVPTRGSKEVAYRFRALRDTVSYLVRAGEAESPMYRISVWKRPAVRRIGTFLSFPGYTGLAPRYEEGGEVRALVGTQVRVEVVANKPLGRAVMRFEGGEEVPMKVEGRRAQGTFAVREEDTYRVCIWDTSGVSNEDPIPYPVFPLRDEPPSVRVRFPEGEYELGEDMQVPLRIEAEDDFGITRLRLAYKREGTDLAVYMPLEIRPGDARTEVAYLWDLGFLNLIPGDRVRYWAEAWDNDQVSGPKQARSEERFLRFPSVEELFQAWEEERYITSKAVASLSREAEGVRRQAREVRRKLLREGKLDWETQKEAEELARRAGEASRELRRLSERWKAAGERMERGEVLLRDTLEKLRKIGELLREALPPELMKALEQVQRALEARDPEVLRRALERIDFSLEDLRRTLDRSLSLLERMKAQAEMDALIKTAEELARRQEEVLRRAKEDPVQMAREEERIREEIRRLGKRLRELSELLRRHPPAPWREVGGLADSLKTWGTDEKAAEAAQALRRGDLGRAMGPGKAAKDELESLVSSLSDLRERMATGWREDVLGELRRVIWDVMYLTGRQEELSQADASRAELSVFQGELAEGLRRSAERLYKVSGKTFLVPPEVGASVGEALRRMQGVVEALEEGHPPVAARARMREVLPPLRRALWLLYLAQRRARGSPAGMGTEEMLAELRRMVRAQEAINRGTEGLLGREIGPSQEELLDRLAVQQAAIRKALEELLRRTGGRAGTAGRLDRVVEEMEEVEKALRERRIDQDTRRRQEKILSRLLDAQRSLRRRGYSRKREAQRPGEYRAVSPGPLPPDALRGDEWEALVREVLKEAPEAYRPLVRQYLEALRGSFAGR